MKLKKSNNKLTVILIVLAIVAVLAIIVAGLLIANSIANEKSEEADRQVVQGINLAVYPSKTIYHVGESFDPTGAKVQVVTKSQDYTYFVDWTQLTFEGFDSSVPNEKLTITVSYEGHHVTFDIVVKEHESAAPTLVGIEVYNFRTTYPKTEWNTYGPDSAGARIRALYSDGSVVEDIILKDKYIYGVGESNVGTTQITIKYSDGVTTVELPVTITITN